MVDYTQPQQKIAGNGENCNIVVAVIFNPANQSFWNLLCILFGFVRTKILNSSANINFSKLFKMSQKIGYKRKFQDIVTTPTTTQRNTTSTQMLGWTRKWLCKPHHHPQKLNSSLCEPQKNIHCWQLNIVLSATTIRATTTTTTTSTTKLSALGASD